MALKDDVLFELSVADGYVSGEQLAEKYNKSRAAVWKAINALKKDGCEISAVTNRGYKIAPDNSVILPAAISKNLERDIPVIFLKSVDSTNTYAKRLLADGRQGEFLVVANEQTAGRGRQGKSFYSPASTGVYFSLVLRPEASVGNAVSVTTAAAVAVCSAIEEMTDKNPKIKWVNDVFVDGRKICGILTEATTDFESGNVDSVIIGIGVNIKTKAFPDDVEGAGCLDADVNRSEFIAKTVNGLLKIKAGDYSPFIDYYRSHSLVLGQEILFTENGRVNRATALEIDERGGLVVRLRDGEVRTLRSGEISVRKLKT